MRHQPNSPIIDPALRGLREIYFLRSIIAVMRLPATPRRPTGAPPTQASAIKLLFWCKKPVQNYMHGYRRDGYGTATEPHVLSS
jgi:hypothetical protein